MFTKEMIAKQLQDLGLSAGDNVMVHASLRKLGKVAGGANSVIEAIMAVIGSSGTMLMVLGSREGNAFDAKTSPSDPEMGRLAEEFRKFLGVEVNDHPASRFAALGKNSKWLLNPAPLHDYHGESSVLQRLVEISGKVLRLAPDIDSTTLTHYAEYLAQVSPKRRVRKKYTTKRLGDVYIESLDDCEGIQDWPHGDYFSQILLDYLAGCRILQGQVGGCAADLLDAADFVRFAKEWMERNLESS